MNMYKLPNGDNVNGILVCKNCNLLWQRDINAGNNMLDIAKFIWAGNGRPNQFTRSIAVSKTVSPSTR
jgi:transposase